MTPEERAAARAWSDWAVYDPNGYVKGALDALDMAEEKAALWEQNSLKRDKIIGEQDDRIAELEAALREIAERSDREPIIESPGWSYIRAIARRTLGGTR